MRFHRVDAEVWGGASDRAVGRRVRGTGRWSDASSNARRRNQDLALTFAGAWASDDRATMAALAWEDVTCRWTGFGSTAAEAVGLPAVLEVGREFERRHGRATHYRVVETLGGTRHAAIMWEPASKQHAERGARIAVYRVEDDRIASISVYGDRLD